MSSLARGQTTRICLLVKFDYICRVVLKQMSKADLRRRVLEQLSRLDGFQALPSPREVSVINNGDVRLVYSTQGTLHVQWQIRKFIELHKSSRWNMFHQLNIEDMRDDIIQVFTLEKVRRGREHIQEYNQQKNQHVAAWISSVAGSCDRPTDKSSLGQIELPAGERLPTASVSQTPRAGGFTTDHILPPSLRTITSARTAPRTVEVNEQTDSSGSPISATMPSLILFTQVLTKGETRRQLQTNRLEERARRDAERDLSRNQGEGTSNSAQEHQAQ